MKGQTMPDPGMQALLFPLLTVFVGLFGACIGSFLNVVVYRLPRGLSLWHPPSHCPACGHRLAVWQNVPVLGWFFLRGRCHYCRGRISFRYPLVEAVTALLFLGLWLTAARAQVPWLAAPRFLFLGGALLAVALIDVEHGIVPDGITASGVCVALLSAVLWPASLAYPGGTGVPPASTGVVAEALAGLLLDGAGVVASTRVLALFEAVGGLAVGFGLPALVRFACQTIWGRRTVCPPAPVPFRLSGGVLHIEGFCAAPPAQVLPETFEEILLELDGPLSPGMTAEDEGRLILTPTTMIVGTRELPLAEAGDRQGFLRRWHFCRDVFGWGDVKLLAMIGAFVGAESAVCILLLASLVATGCGLLLLALRRGRALTLPFAAFLALAATVWLFFGDRLVLWYATAILGLHSGLNTL